MDSFEEIIVGCCYRYKHTDLYPRDVNEIVLCISIKMFNGEPWAEFFYNDSKMQIYLAQRNKPGYYSLTKVF